MVAVKFMINEYSIEMRPGFDRITISSPLLAHGIRNRALLTFTKPPSDFLGAITNINSFNYDGFTIILLIERVRFQDFYKVLQSENPVFLQVEYSDTDRVNTKITNYNIFTGAEPLGEGPLDKSLAAFLPDGFTL